MKGLLVLEDGSAWHGEAIGRPGTSFGEIVFNLIESQLMSKTEEDCRNDFHDVFDLDAALVQGYEIPLVEAE